MTIDILQNIRIINMEYLPEELREVYENDIKCCNDLELDKELINISDILKSILYSCRLFY